MAGLFVLLAAGCSRSSEPSEVDRLVQMLGSKEQTGREQRFADFLLKHGHQTEPYLGFPGYSGCYAMRLGGCRRLKIEGRPHVLMDLHLNTFSIPGDCARRLVLVSEFGKVIDVATVVWPSRLMERFTTDLVDAPGSDNAVLRFRDDKPDRDWGNFRPPYFDLHEKKGTQVSMPWTGAPILGDLVVEKERFVAVPRKR